MEINNDDRIPVFLHSPQMFFGAAFDFFVVSMSISVIAFVFTQGSFIILAIFFTINHTVAVILTQYDPKIAQLLLKKGQNQLFFEQIGTVWKHKSYDPF